MGQTQEGNLPLASNTSTYNKHAVRFFSGIIIGALTFDDAR